MEIQMNAAIKVLITIEAGEGENPWNYIVSVDGDIPDSTSRNIRNDFCKIDWEKNFPELSPSEVLCIYGVLNENVFTITHIEVNKWELPKERCEKFANMCNISVIQPQKSVE